MGTRSKGFLFSNGNRKGGEYKAALIVGRFKIIKYAKKHAGPFFARILAAVLGWYLGGFFLRYELVVGEARRS